MVSVPRATLFGCTAAVIVTSDVPLNEAEPLRSPPREIVRAFCNAVAVPALPDTSPVTFPVNDAETWANVTDDEVPTAWPIETVGLEPSPGVWLTVTPVPAVMSFT